MTGPRTKPNAGRAISRRLACPRSPNNGCHMEPAEEFRRRAAECEGMAKFTRDPESKATWSCLADRWRRCADKFARESSAAREHISAKRHREPAANGNGARAAA